MSNTKAGNVKSAMGNPRTRTIFLGSISIVVIIMIVLGMILTKGPKADPALASEVSAAPEVQGNFETAGASTAEYDALLAKSNKENAENALATGTSSIPVPRGAVEQSLIDPAVEPTTPGIQATAPEQQMQVPPPAPMNPANDPNYQAAVAANEQAITTLVTAMKSQATKLEDAWKIHSHTQSLITRTRNSDASGGVEGGMSSADHYQAALAAADVTSNAIRAGDQLYATLDTAINSDEIGPVLATVRQPGPFQGARLIGQINMGQGAKAVGVQFTAMAVVGEKATRSINAWAVDPNKDNRAALATDVDNHYLSNGAKIFIGSFLAGYSDGLLRGGQKESVVSNGTTTVVQRDAYTNQQLLEIGVGNVGRTVSQNLSQGSTRRRTVKVAAGIDIGVLFLQDAAPQR